MLPEPRSAPAGTGKGGLLHKRKHLTEQRRKAEWIGSTVAGEDRTPSTGKHMPTEKETLTHRLIPGGPLWAREISGHGYHFQASLFQRAQPEPP